MPVEWSQDGGKGSGFSWVIRFDVLQIIEALTSIVLSPPLQGTPNLAFTTQLVSYYNLYYCRILYCIPIFISPPFQCVIISRGPILIFNL
jgi:hypothetical protein